jgi:hypothetical protein
MIVGVGVFAGLALFALSFLVLLSGKSLVVRGIAIVALFIVAAFCAIAMAAGARDGEIGDLALVLILAAPLFALAILKLTVKEAFAAPVSPGPGNDPP